MLDTDEDDADNTPTRISTWMVAQMCVPDDVLPQQR